MKKIGFLLVGLLAVIVSYGAWCAQQSNPDKEKLIFSTLFSVLEQVHFAPQELNDDFSKKVFTAYLDGIDGTRWFLTQQEVSQLQAYETRLDDLAKENSLEFFDLSVALLENAMKRSEKIYQEVVNEKFDLSKKETLQLDSDKLSFPADEAEQKDYWRKYVKYQLITKMNELLDEQAELPKAEQKSLEEIQKTAQEDTRKLFDDVFERIGELRRSDHFETYLNAYVNLYDPHTVYFSPKGKQDFDIRMGGKLEGIGARLAEAGEYTKIASIVPGGPAWQGKELEVDDVILKVTQKGEEAMDIRGMRIDDVVSLVRGKKGTQVTLTVRKKGGNVEEIKIIRDEIILEVAHARSAILEIPDHIEKIGYINLPSFYSSFDGEAGNSCAIDVAKEIVKLKQADVNGIVLDLRFNGGGSLPDVIDMSGLFIEDGPIVQVKSRNQRPEVYNDENPDVLYDGPLVVLVNAHSASASEILAGALQDYGRAVIVGSSSTFGKGTVQGFFDLDRVVIGNSEHKPLGQLKMTFQKFYRVNGGSNQLRGIIPDIILPDEFSYIKTGEKEETNPLDWSEIRAVPHQQSVYQLPDLGVLQKKSKERVAVSKAFEIIDTNAKRLRDNHEQTEYPLALNDFRTLLDQREQASKEYENLKKGDIPVLEVENLVIDLEKMEGDSAKIGRNEDFIQRLEKDVYLEECLFILKDMIEAEKRYAKK